MADSVKVNSVDMVAGSMPRAINTPADCPTIIADGMSGASVSTHMVRLHFVEHVGFETEMLAKHVITLAFDTEQFGKLVEAVALIRDQIQPPKTEGA